MSLLDRFDERDRAAVRAHERNEVIIRSKPSWVVAVAIVVLVIGAVSLMRSCSSLLG